MGIRGIQALYSIEDEVQHMAENQGQNETDHDEEDVKSALERETHDGSGFDSEDELPESDFDSFSEDEVENDHDGDNEGDDTEDEAK